VIRAHFATVLRAAEGAETCGAVAWQFSPLRRQPQWFLLPLLHQSQQQHAADDPLYFSAVPSASLRLCGVGPATPSGDFTLGLSEVAGGDQGADIGDQVPRRRRAGRGDADQPDSMHRNILARPGNPLDSPQRRRDAEEKPQSKTRSDSGSFCYRPSSSRGGRNLWGCRLAILASEATAANGFCSLCCTNPSSSTRPMTPYISLRFPLRLCASAVNAPAISPIPPTASTQSHCSSAPRRDASRNRTSSRHSPADPRSARYTRARLIHRRCGPGRGRGW
jgi:hypothetical protein